jgi:uncharacterized protein (TIGR03435 family)
MRNSSRLSACLGVHRRPGILPLLALALLAHAQDHPAFEVASVKPSNPSRSEYKLSGNRYAAHARLHDLMIHAFDLRPFQVIAPDWTSSSYFDVAATAAAPISNDQLKPMLIALLSDRFRMKYHHETRDFSLQVIVMGKQGHHLTPSTLEGPMQTERNGRKLTFKGATPGDLASLLSGGGPSTIDGTGLTGRYDFVLDWGRFVDPTSDDMSSFIQAMRDAMQKDLGLDIETKKVSLEVVIIDHVEKRPVEN